MLPIETKPTALFVEHDSRFIYVPCANLQLEHSLAALAKWESKWHKPFLKCLADQTIDKEMLLSYIACMIQDIHIRPDKKSKFNTELFSDPYKTEEQKQYLAFAILQDPEISKKVLEYLNDQYTATWFNKDTQKGSTRGETITAEILYYDMFKLRIPLECENWHLNRLLTLIRVFGEKDNPKKMSKNETLARNHNLNKQRLAKGKYRG